MRGVKAIAVSAILLWLAAAAQQSLAARMQLAGGSPDFPLIVIACVGLFMSRASATQLGFAAGLVEGAVAGANLTIYIVSRTVAGFSLGWFNGFEVEANAALAFLAAFITTLIAQFVLMLMGAMHGPLQPFLEGTLVAAVYDGVIAIPLFLLLRRLLGSPSG